VYYLLIQTVILQKMSSQIIAAERLISYSRQFARRLIARTLARSTDAHGVVDVVQAMIDLLYDGLFITHFFNLDHAHCRNVDEFLSYVNLDRNGRLHRENNLIYWAVIWNNPYVIRQLLRKGADPNRTTIGYTHDDTLHPVWHALVSDRPECVKALLAHNDANVSELAHTMNLAHHPESMRLLFKHDTYDIHLAARHY